jgi:glycine/D-amino acid oxidase-like deaminating enzyme
VPSGIVACSARRRYRAEPRCGIMAPAAVADEVGVHGMTSAAMSLAPDYSPTPLWCDDVGYPDGAAGPLPARADVLIVGAGYTGLVAARETARAGRSTLVLEAGPIGGGCSSRNGGQVAFSLKPELKALTARHGAGVARALYREGFEALAELRALAQLPGVDCDWRDNGCFYGAHTRHQFERHKRALAAQPHGFEVPVRVIEPRMLPSATGSRLYHGGFVYPEDAALHPLRLLRALHARARAAGAAAYAHCRVAALERSSDGFIAHTERGTVAARQVLLATNGYGGTLSPWHRRRVIPIGSYIIATEPLPAAVVERLLPQGRNLVDTRRVVMYVRPSPDGRRILFGGRAAAAETDPSACVPRLKAMLVEVFPELAAVRISRAWMGFVAYTFDTLPHLGSRDGLYYCMGYCGQGLPLASYYGRRIGLQMLGDPDGATALDGLAFPTRPFYTGRPWFLPAAILGYRLRDRLGW